MNGIIVGFSTPDGEVDFATRTPVVPRVGELFQHQGKTYTVSLVTHVWAEDTQSMEAEVLLDGPIDG